MKTTPVDHDRALFSVWDVVGMLIAAVIMFSMIVSGIMPVGS